MEIVTIEKVDLSVYEKSSLCDVYFIHVKVSDIAIRAQSMIETVSDVSWIGKLGVVAQATFKATSKRTIEKLVTSVLENVVDQVTEEFGEYLVSDSAQCALNDGCGHVKVPLAELLKEKVIGNPGFDFHTESTSCLVAFGEAKYSAGRNPHGIAIRQISEFIDLEKDMAELNVLEHFVSDAAMTNALELNKAYVAAFSMNSQSPLKIFINALQSEYIDHLLSFPELYLIGVEIDA